MRSVHEVGVFVSLASFLKCNGTREYVRRLQSSRLARSVGGLGNRVPVVFDRGTIAGPNPAPSVGDCVVLPDLTPFFKGCGVIVLRDHARAVRGLRAIAAGLLAIGCDLGCI